MSRGESRYLTTPIEPSDAESGFTCGKRALDDYIARHAVTNESVGIGRTYVLRRTPEDGPRLPPLLGFYTLSMATAESTHLSKTLAKKLPKYPMPVALVGRLAIDRRAQGRRLGEALLLDALRRVLDAAAIVGCLGVIVDAKDAEAVRFYEKYDFVTITDEGWPRRMFLSIGTIRAAFSAP